MSHLEQLSESKRRLLERVLRGEMARETWDAPLERRSPGATVPLAPSQQQVWLHSQMGDTRFLYNEPITIHYHGALDQRLFERSFREFLRRHEIWRTTFSSIDGQVVQLVHPEMALEIPLVDLTELPEKDREEEATRLATLDAQRPFDLSVGPLLRGRLFRLRDDKYRFHLTLHHIIFDGVSIYRTVLPELSAIYNAFAKGEASPLPEPAFQYADFALWQDRLQNSKLVDKQVEYWREQLSGDLPLLQLSEDHPRPPLPSYRGGMEKFALSATLSEAVKRRSKIENVTHYMFLLASFKAMLHRYSGQEDILVGGATDGRKRHEFHELLGYFLNTLVLRTKPKASLTFREYLAQVKDAVVGALANSDVPFDRLVRELQPKRDSSRHPFFQALFSIEPPATPVALPWELTQMDIQTGAAKVDLYLEIDEHEDHLIARFIFNTDVFDRSTIQRMRGHWLSILEAAAANPDMLIRDMPMLTDDEHRWLREASAGRALPIPEISVHQMVEAQTLRTPQAIAVEWNAEQITYQRLNQESVQLARRLRNAGVQNGDLIGLCVERSSRMVPALLGILKSGGAYVPIDPSLPSQRISYMIEDSHARVIVTERAFAERFADSGAIVICCDEPADSPDADLPTVAPSDLAYVIYTSGSTGRPKGVEVTHRALANFLLSMQREPGFSADDRVLAVTTISFDIASLEIYLPLICGGCVVIADRDEVRDPGRLIHRMRESRCSVMQATPATWRALIDANWEGDANLKILCGGEALPRDLSQQLRPRCSELWNMYGPTETTVWSTIHRVDDQTAGVSIGRPIANTDVFVLDANRNLLPIGVAGELYIGGAGVARGYHDRDELTRERFVASPFDPTQRLYRTGDLARWLTDGTLECLGRADNQVKIRGFRVEIGEIEAAIAAHPEVRQSAVKVWTDAAGSSLAAYVVAASRIDLRGHLQKALPDYMIPSRVVFLDALPLTPNGKLDRNALPAPERAAQTGARRFTAPQNSIERRLARVFESVLDVDKIGVEESFFDLGGHSLLVAKLLRRIELEFGRRLSMSTIFQAPTIRHLAARLGEQNCLSVAAPRTVSIRSNGERAPFFWLYGGPFYSGLGSRITPAHPMISISLNEQETAELHPGCTLEQVAEPLVRKIRTAQPTGPYHLGGWCAFGLLAWEVASQLLAQGEQVALLAMIASPNPPYDLSITAGRIYASKLRYRLRSLNRLRARVAADWVVERVKRLFDSRRKNDRPLDAFDGILTAAALRYAPKALAARVVLFRESERPEEPDLRVGWEQVMGDRIQVVDIPGDHVSIFSEPHVQTLAERMNQYLEPATYGVRTPAGVARA